MAKPRVSDFIKSLGETSKEVAESVRKLGIKAVPGNECQCAIAVAINAHTSGWGGIHVRKGGSLSWNDCQITDPQSTPAVREFVKDFDAGKYPDLVGTRQDVELYYLKQKAKDAGLL